jgi:RNA polymerase sigma-70 factor (ECF subfamily)
VGQGIDTPSLPGPPDTANERRERFERTFDLHFRAVFAYALRRASRAEAEDAVAETFLVAWRRLDELPSNAKPWLLGVARRVLANQRRAATRRAALTERLAREPRATPQTLARSPCLEALARLSDADRELLLLIAWEGLSTEEAAVSLGCSRTAAKVRLHRARRRLRAELERPEPGEGTPVIPTSRLEECHED